MVLATPPTSTAMEIPAATCRAARRLSSAAGSSGHRRGQHNRDPTIHCLEDSRRGRLGGSREPRSVHRLLVASAATSDSRQGRPLIWPTLQPKEAKGRRDIPAAEGALQGLSLMAPTLRGSSRRSSCDSRVGSTRGPGRRVAQVRPILGSLEGMSDCPALAGRDSARNDLDTSRTHASGSTSKKASDVLGVSSIRRRSGGSRWARPAVEPLAARRNTIRCPR
jgi:hypothetical protein